MLERTDNCETFELKRGIVLLRRQQIFSVERDCALDSTVIALKQHETY